MKVKLNEFVVREVQMSAGRVAVRNTPESLDALASALTWAATTMRQNASKDKRDDHVPGRLKRL